MLNGEVIPKVHPDFKQEYSYRMAVLEIEKVTAETSGRFVCIAENSMGTDETECLISVEGKARFGRLAKLLSQTAMKRAQILWLCFVI